jgi:hypothetical protein
VSKLVCTASECAELRQMVAVELRRLVFGQVVDIGGPSLTPPFRKFRRPSTVVRLLARRSPPRCSRCRSVRPDDTEIEATPQSRADIASLDSRCGLSPAVTSSWPAVSTPTPGRGLPMTVASWPRTRPARHPDRRAPRRHRAVRAPGRYRRGGTARTVATGLLDPSALHGVLAEIEVSTCSRYASSSQKANHRNEVTAAHLDGR